MAKPASHHSDDVQVYDRKPLSQKEGFRRIEASLEKLELRDKAREKLCEVCGRRCRAWRIVPCTEGQRLGVTEASLLSGGLRGKFIVACDAGPNGCAEMLLRAGVDKPALEEQRAEERLRELGIVVK